MNKYKDILGKIFDKLVVIGMSDIRSKNGQIMWKCMCDCGSITYVRGDSLRSGAVKSCGCWGREKRIEATFNDITGQKFGRLTAIEPTDRRLAESVVWKCLCECGKYAFTTSSNLKSGHTQSCGCLQKDIIIKLLTTHGMSRTKSYNNAQARKRRELKALYDSEYGCELEKALKEFFSACVICGMTREEHIKKYGKDLHNDHVLPLSKGYGLVPGNAVVLCRTHNSSKLNRSLDKLPLEWQASLIWNAFKFKDYWYQLENNS